ncbi:GAF domain-containing sensor histidine kinase [Raoultibacter phocaeensis]|uniref:GAF domain-containing sensor histidine kinase n=1 Tax=Raoultibacter phocaeensis TaxID=2479841 RepID=UPI00111986D3|nr:GAF domain-containing sensor histidine kinase [Raoultibacter phocaeensis]
MAASNFPEETLAGGCTHYAQTAEALRNRYGFDFVAIGLTAFVGAPLKWIYSAGATGERHKRIVLAPGHGIGGIVIKSGKPMLFTDIDEEIDPQEYSSYPIVFAEDLRSFCALPLTKNGRVVGSLLAAFRTVREGQVAIYQRMIDDLDGVLCDLQVVSEGFMNFEKIVEEKRPAASDGPVSHSEITRIIGAQEDERKRISRELHDGIAQELWSVSFSLKRLREMGLGEEERAIIDEAGSNIERILDELHNITVELRPSALDHLGFASALRSQAVIFEKTYGAEIVFEGGLASERFPQALETQAYRICQEAILNACKYSDSDRITVSIEEAGGWLSVEISDEGRGFDVSNPEVKGSGCGLPGMKERANLIGATLSIESGEGGTTVTLVAPMRTDEGAA